MALKRFRITTPGFIKRHPRLSRWGLIAGLFLVSFGSGLGFASWALVCRSGQCPAVEELDNYQPRQTSKLYAADGRFIAELGLERRTLIQISEMPAMLRDAFLVVEDKNGRLRGVDGCHATLGIVITKVGRPAVSTSGIGSAP